MPSHFATKTKVPVDKSRAEIERTLMRYGAKSFGCFTEVSRAVIVFEAQERRLRFDLPLPTGERPAEQQQRRQRWRALLLSIKSKLECVESGIETFEEAFLAHVVLPDGLTVGQHVYPAIAATYKGEPMPALLPAPKGSKDG